MKLEAVVVTVALAEEEEYLSALAKQVHITALQVNSNPPHSSLSEDDASADGKIMFRKPVKRSSDNKFQRITATSSKKKKGNEKKDSDDSKTATENLQKKVKNSSLLSFGDDEEED
ncbi:hypothetical protein EOD39_15345 [Acipenser ruthenus]|uniref:DUF4604 domain-containing protein n=1 Tax=Acipenser ruthenus TaxID=7906 RepID=A0A662YJ15_ACIRT|nr:hypothetical protein EOD39_15345 [Acipenser ruthenus]